VIRYGRAPILIGIRSVLGAPALLLVALLVLGPAGAATPPRSGAYLYVFPDRALDVYDIGSGRRVEQFSLPDAHAIRGVAAAPRTSTLFLSVGGNGGANGTGSVIAYDLRTNRVRWKRAFTTGTDGLGVTPDGRRLYVLARDARARFNVLAITIDPATGRPVGQPFQVTRFGRPDLLISPDVDQAEMSLSADRLILTMKRVTGSIWMLDGL